MKASENGKQLTNDRGATVTEAVYQYEYLVSCDIPTSRKRRSTDKTVEGYDVALSYDGYDVALSYDGYDVALSYDGYDVALSYDGYDVALSYNGINYGDYVTVIIYDEDCFACNATTVTCVRLVSYALI